MGGEGICDSGLVLRLGYEGWAAASAAQPPRVKPEPNSLQYYCSTSPPLSAASGAEPSLSLSLAEAPAAAPEVDAGGRGDEPIRVQQPTRQSSPHSAVSSFSGAYPASSGGTARREKEAVSEEVEAEIRGVFSCRASDEEEEGGSARKKLRLTKSQSALLEDMFREHSTLNPKQKQALAKQLNLRPRQVEVWFQNRRARTKLKQTEMDCELLRRCCESLTDENRRLQKELQELRALKFASPAALYMQLRRRGSGGSRGRDQGRRGRYCPLRDGGQGSLLQPLRRPSAACGLLEDRKTNRLRSTSRLPPPATQTLLLSRVLEFNEITHSRSSSSSSSS